MLDEVGPRDEDVPTELPVNERQRLALLHPLSGRDPAELAGRVAITRTGAVSIMVILAVDR